MKYTEVYSLLYKTAQFDGYPKGQTDTIEIGPIRPDGTAPIIQNPGGINRADPVTGIVPELNLDDTPVPQHTVNTDKVQSWFGVHKGKPTLVGNNIGKSVVDQLSEIDSGLTRDKAMGKSK